MVAEFSPINRVLRTWETLTLAGGQVVEFQWFGDNEARALVVLHSIEYPAPPPWSFCMEARERGLSVVVIRRPGFGASTPALSLEAETAVYAEVFDVLELDDAVLLANGSACAAGYSFFLGEPRVAMAALANNCLGPLTPDILKPDWIDAAIRQGVGSRAGMRLALGALKSAVKLRGALWVYEEMTSASAGDLAFLSRAAAEVEDAARAFAALDVVTFSREIEYGVARALPAFRQVRPDRPVALLCGQEASPEFRRLVEERAADCALPVTYLPVGDYFCGYLNPLSWL